MTSAANTPMLLLMVMYTFTSPWILAQPITAGE